MQQRLLRCHVPQLTTCCQILGHRNEDSTDLQQPRCWPLAEPEVSWKKEPFLLSPSGQAARQKAQIWQPFVQLHHQSRVWKMFGWEARSCSHCAGSKHSTLSFPWFLSTPGRTFQAAIPRCFSTFLPPSFGTVDVTGCFLHDFWDGCRLLWLLLSWIGYFLTERSQVQAEATEVSYRKPPTGRKEQQLLWGSQGEGERDTGGNFTDLYLFLAL